MLKHTVFAWMETWRIEDGDWRLTALASTERSGTEDIAEAERQAIPDPAGEGGLWNMKAHLKETTKGIRRMS